MIKDNVLVMTTNVYNNYKGEEMISGNVLMMTTVMYITIIMVRS